MVTLRTRLREIADVGLVSLKRASLLNLVAVGLLLLASLWIRQTAADAQQVSELALLAEVQRGLVSRVVAEMDLTRQAEIKKRFATTSDDLAAGSIESRLDIGPELEAARKSGDEIFVFAAAFAQQQALAASDGPFADATGRIQARIAEQVDRANASALRALMGMFALGLAAIVLQRSIGSRAEQRLTVSMDRLADGIASSVEWCASAAERIAAGHLQSQSSSMALETQETDRLKGALTSMETRLKAILGEIQVAAETLSQGAHQVSAAAQALSAGTARQAASMEETTANVQQMSSSIAENADLSRLTEGLASQNVAGARQGSESVRDTVLALERVVATTSIIEDLARRTHLLSLNAAIEAARAGDQGRGFAVIASEVRALSGKSASALLEIRSVAESSIEVGRRTAAMINGLVPTSEQTAAAANQAAAASTEQLATARQIDRAMTDIDAVTQSNAASSEQLAATAEAISGQAQQLRRTAGYFRVAGSAGTVV